MKEQKEKNNGGINYGVLIAIAIIASVFIGIRIYTKHLEKQNMEALSRIIEKNPDFLSNRQTSSNSNSKMIWKTYSNDILNFKYPAIYSIRTEKSGDMTQVYCEANENEDYAVINFTYIINLDTKSLSTIEKRQRCINGIKEMQKPIEEEFNASFSQISSAERGNLNGYTTTFEGDLYGLYEIQGEIFMCFHNNKAVAIALQCEKGKSVEYVKKIIESIKVE